MKDKELLIRAVDNYDLYVESQRLTLKALIDIAINGLVTISPTALSKLLKIGRGVIYHNLHLLEKDGFIKKSGKSRKRATLYELNEIKLNEIIKIYNKKLKYL
jgi:DNA-binding MarR family transcriptional regulator